MINIGEKASEIAKNKALEIGENALGKVKEEAVKKVAEITVDPAIEGLKKSVKDQLNANGIIEEVKKDFNVDEIKNQLKLDDVPSQVKANFNINEITSDLNMNDIFSGVDFSELEAQGVDTKEIKKAISEAQSQIRDLSIDTSMIDMKSYGIDIESLKIDPKSIFTGSTGDIKSKIEGTVNKFKNVKASIDANKTTQDMINSIKTNMPDNLTKVANETKTQVNASIASVKSTMSSVMSGVSGFGGFRR